MALATPRVTGRYRITTGDGRSTEELVETGSYGYAHSCVISENLPARHFEGREIVLLAFDLAVTSVEAVAGALAAGLERPEYEDALYFGVEHPEVQRDGPIVFLHDPWFGYFGRREVLCLWTNAGRRELGLEGFVDDELPLRVRPDARPRSDLLTRLETVGVNDRNGVPNRERLVFPLRARASPAPPRGASGGVPTPPRSSSGRQSPPHAPARTGCPSRGTSRRPS